MILNNSTQMVAKKIQKIADYKFFLSLLIVTLIVGSCARPAAPTGGLKDEDPPKPVKSSPINYSTNFKGNKITIQFDEFVVLKNVTQELLVSPPLEEQPEIGLRGKNLLIKLNNELKDSTTYGINFYESIADLNEGNMLKNFQFEFSTGDVFDSLYIAGNVKNAFNYSTEKGLFVMLYSELNDTLPRTTKPDYVSKTDEDGNFMITNMKNIPYYIFALADLNNNLLFDLPNEGIAFLDSAFNPSYHEVNRVDTIVYIDSISPNFNDTVFADSLHRYTEMVTTIGNIQLFMFEEDNDLQYFIQEYRPERQQIILSFNKEVSDSFLIKPLIDTLINENWYLKEAFPENDSLVFWLTDSLLYNNDSLLFEISYLMKDSNHLVFTQIDTLPIYFESVDEDKKGNAKGSEKRERRFKLNDLLGKQDEEKIPEDTVIKSELTFKTNAKSPFELNTQINLEARFPIKNIADTAIKLLNIIDDTVEINVAYNLVIDTLSNRKITLLFEKEEEEAFKLMIPAGTVTDIYDNINDTLLFEFKTRPLDYYGTLKLNIQNVREYSIVQLFDEKEKVLINEQIILGDTVLFYENLHPKKFIIKLFYDKNKNSKWDTGEYKDLLQPEKVFYFPQEVNIKSNFDYDYIWNLYPIAPNEPELLEEL